MTSQRSTSDTSILAYGALAGAARAFLPPFVDAAALRAVRGAMFDRMARAEGVTLTADARDEFVEIERTAAKRGVVGRVAGWVAGRLLPGSSALDFGRQMAWTLGAGALFKRYLETHRPEPRAAVLGGAEAAKVRAAMKAALDPFATVDATRSIARGLMEPMRDARAAHDGSIVQRYSDAAVATVAELPAAWIDAVDEAFAKALAAQR